MSGCVPAITRYFANALPAVDWRRRPTSRCWFALTCAEYRPSPIASSPELRHAAGALGAVGRNLNQIARVAHQTGRVQGLTTADLRAMLAAFEKLRVHFKGLIEANIASWETGHAKANH
jgi:hypothetical protein